MIAGVLTGVLPSVLASVLAVDPGARSADVAGGALVELRGGWAPVLPGQPQEPSMLLIVQPDIAKSHGLSEAIRIAALADAFDVQFMPHCFMIGAGYAHTIHLAAALNVPLLERLAVHLAAEPMGEIVKPKNGKVAVPQGPGLGCQPDADAIRLYRVG